MSEINSHDDIQTLPQEREKLYQLVWSEPAERITALYDISTELLAKRCSEMCIPRPLAGYWKALAKGSAPAIPALPALKKGGAVKVLENNTPSVQPSAIAVPKQASPVTRKQAPVTGNGYGLINDLKKFLPASSVTEDGYYKPTKKKLLDLNVSDTGFDSAIEFLSRFFDALGKRGTVLRWMYRKKGCIVRILILRKIRKGEGIVGATYGGLIRQVLFVLGICTLRLILLN